MNQESKALLFCILADSVPDLVKERKGLFEFGDLLLGELISLENIIELFWRLENEKVNSYSFCLSSFT